VLSAGRHPHAPAGDGDHQALGAEHIDRLGHRVEPSKQPTGEYLAGWLDSLRLAPSTVASYRKNVRLHIIPAIGAVPLASLTPVVLDKLYRQLESGGRAGHREGEGLSARTVRYVHGIISSALRDAVEAGLLTARPASRAHPPTARQARAPEMHPWTAAQLAAFLAWSREKSQLHTAWHVLAMTGMRRGELLAMRWRDIDLDAGTISVRRSVGVVKALGQPEQITEGSTKTGKARVIDIDPGTVAVLRSWKAERGSMALALAKPDALAFGNIQGAFRHPETFSKLFAKTVARCRTDLGDDAVPKIRLHDLRHAHATILVSDREPVSTVSQRLGHASEVVTLTIYSHVLPGDQKRAATRFAELVGQA
jgi:integrase